MGPLNRPRGPCQAGIMGGHRSLKRGRKIMPGGGNYNPRLELLKNEMKIRGEKERGTRIENQIKKPLHFLKRFIYPLWKIRQA